MFFHTQYRGWIPTDTGNLSFSVIGSSGRPKKNYTSYHQCGHSRYTVVAQTRRTTDANLLSDLLTDLFVFLNGRTASTRYVLAAKSIEKEHHNQNSGFCYIFSKNEYKKVLLTLSEYENKIRVVGENIGDERRCKAFGWLNEELIVHQKNDAKSAVSKILLLRNGQIDIELIRCGGASIRGRLEKFFSSNFMLKRFGKVKDLAGIDYKYCEQTDLDLMVSQSYFFIKDITHNHKHHHPSSDTIVKIYHAKNSDDLDLIWRRETLYDLYHWIISKKRAKSTSDLKSALGVLAYTKSFERIHVQKYVAIPENQEKFPEYDADILKESLNATLARCEDQKTPFFRDILIWGLPLISLVLASLAIIATTKDTLSIPTTGSYLSFRSTVEYFILYPHLLILILIFPPIVAMVFRWIPKRFNNSFPDMKVFFYMAGKYIGIVAATFFFFFFFKLSITVTLKSLDYMLTIDLSDKWKDFLLLIIEVVKNLAP